MSTQWSVRTSLLALPLFLLLAVGAAAAQLPASSNDLASLADKWWGTSFERFPAAANLQPGEFTQSVYEGHKAYAVTARGKWTPAALSPFAFAFSPENGLVKMSGLLDGSMDQLLNLLRKLYGPYDDATGALGYTTYVWRFGKTVLEVTSNGTKAFTFNLHPQAR